MASVTSQLTRINDLEGSPTFVSIGGGPGGGANTDIFLQGAQSGGRRLSNVTLSGFLVDDAASNDLSAASVHVGAWMWVTHYGSLTNLRIRIASNSASTNYDEHIIPLTEYPSLGGWIRVWVDISRTPDATGGTALDESTARYFGPVVSLPTVGGNVANVIIDAIDYTTGGLLLTGTSGVWQDFLTADEGNTTNKYGVVTSKSGIITCQARLTLGSSSSLEFSDSGFTIIFPQQNLVEDTFMGITADLQNASTSITWTNGTLQSPGTKKGDLIVTGTSGIFTATSCNFIGLRVITCTSEVTLTSCAITSVGLITQSSAVFTDCTFVNLTGAVGILSDDPSKISDCTFTSDGTGHAIEISVPGTYTFDGNIFSGYGSNDTTDAAIYNNSGGAVTLNITGGGSTPTIRNGTGASTTVNNAVTISVTVKNTAGSAIQNARVAVYTDNSLETELMNELTDSNGLATEGYAYTSDQAVFIRVRAASGSPAYLDVETNGTITSAGLAVQVTMQVDLNV